MNEKYKLSKVNLPKEIAEIHLGFSSQKFFVGYADIGECTEVDISFNNKDRIWTIRAVCDGKEYIKKYKKHVCDFALKEILETEESATVSAADVN